MRDYDLFKSLTDLKAAPKVGNIPKVIFSTYLDPKIVYALQKGDYFFCYFSFDRIFRMESVIQMDSWCKAEQADGAFGHLYSRSSIQYRGGDFQKPMDHCRGTQCNRTISSEGFDPWNQFLWWRMVLLWNV